MLASVGLVLPRVARCTDTRDHSISRNSLHFSPCHAIQRDYDMSLGTILLIVLILFLIGALPTWPYSGAWGYYPSGFVGVILIVLIVLLLMGRL